MAQASSLMQFLIVVLAAWLAREQEGFIEYPRPGRCLKAYWRNLVAVDFLTVEVWKLHGLRSLVRIHPGGSSRPTV